MGRIEYCVINDEQNFVTSVYAEGESDGNPFVLDYALKENETLLKAEYPHGIFRPRWNGVSWVEIADPKEIASALLK